jgi:hypothetical protein
MASPQKSGKRESFYEVILQGSPKVVRGFLAGLDLGAGQHGTIIYNYDAGIFHEDLREKVSEWMHLRTADCHAVVDAGLARLIRKLEQDIRDLTGLELIACRHVRTATLAFRYTAYARRYHEQIEALLRELPEGLKLKDFDHDVREDPGAKGTEVYTPAHDFEAHGEGKIVGRIDLLVDYRERMKQQPLIEIDEIRLRLA